VRGARVGIAAAWAALSTWAGLGAGGPFALANLPSVALVAYALATGFRPALAAAVAWLLPSICALALRDTLLGATAMLLALYLAELADLLASATHAVDLGYVEERAREVTMISAAALALTWGALALARTAAPLELDFWALASVLLALVALAAAIMRGAPGH